MTLIINADSTCLPPRGAKPLTEPERWPPLVALSWALYASPSEQVIWRYAVIHPDGFTIPDRSVVHHGVTHEKALDEGLPIADVLQSLNDDISLYAPSRVVAHQVSFHLGMLMAECRRNRIPMRFLGPRTFCTLKGSISLCQIPSYTGEGYKWPSLSELHYHLLEHPTEDAQQPGGKVLTVARCFFKLLELGYVPPHESHAPKPLVLPIHLPS